MCERERCRHRQIPEIRRRVRTRINYPHVWANRTGGGVWHIIILLCCACSHVAPSRDEQRRERLRAPRHAAHVQRAGAARAHVIHQVLCPVGSTYCPQLQQSFFWVWCFNSMMMPHRVAVQQRRNGRLAVVHRPDHG